MRVPFEGTEGPSVLNFADIGKGQWKVWNFEVLDVQLQAIDGVTAYRYPNERLGAIACSRDVNLGTGWYGPDDPS